MPNGIGPLCQDVQGDTVSFLPGQESHESSIDNSSKLRKNISLPVGIDLWLKMIRNLPKIISLGFPLVHFGATTETNGVECTFPFYHTNHFESGVQMSAFEKQGDDPEPPFLDRTFSFQHGPFNVQRHCGVRCAFIAEVSVIVPWY